MGIRAGWLGCVLLYLPYFHDVKIEHHLVRLGWSRPLTGWNFPLLSVVACSMAEQWLTEHVFQSSSAGPRFQGDDRSSNGMPIVVERSCCWGVSATAGCALCTEPTGAVIPTCIHSSTCSGMHVLTTSLRLARSCGDLHCACRLQPSSNWSRLEEDVDGKLGPGSVRRQTHGRSSVSSGILYGTPDAWFGVFVSWTFETSKRQSRTSQLGRWYLCCGVRNTEEAAPSYNILSVHPRAQSITSLDSINSCE